MTTDDLQLQNFADLIWNVADDLRGVFQDDAYGTVILPFVLLRRIECALEPSREKVVKRFEILKALNILLEAQYADALKKEAKAPFFNTTLFTLNTIGASNTLADMEAYLDGFSENLRIIFEKLCFKNVCKQLQDADLLYSTIQHFKQLDLDPERVPVRAMSNLYEELIWKFAASKHKASKEFLTPRDVVRLATTLLLDSDEDILTSNKGLIREIYDPTCGTCGFINDAMELINEFSDKKHTEHPAMLIPYGQDISPEAWALGRTMMLLQSMQYYDPKSGEVPLDRSTGIALENTLTNDAHRDKTFDYVFSNPPFGMDWSKDFQVVSKDARFSHIGLPPKSDGSMLFLTLVAQKLNDTGRGAIVLSGSPLFTGDAGSGSSEIRRWLFENDIVETIVQLPGNLFYNTPIQTYLWILNKNKSAMKKGKIQLIDATEHKTLIKNIGCKRFVISDADIEAVARIVGDYKDSDISRVVPYSDLGYRNVTVQRPLRILISVSEDKIYGVSELKFAQKLDAESLESLQTLLSEIGSGNLTVADFTQALSEAKLTKGKLGKPAIRELVRYFGVRDENAEPCRDDKGKYIADPDFKITETVSLSGDLDTYMKKEVLPFAPDAYVDVSITDNKDGKVGVVGYEVNFNRYFYKYVPPRPPKELAVAILELEDKTRQMMREIFE